MYGGRHIEQEKLDGSVNTFNMTLKKENRWIKMSLLIPRKDIERKYAKQFNNDRNDGRPTKTAREAFGSLVIQQLLNLTDREMFDMIQENSYIKYFLGYSEFRLGPPFDDSTMVHFRKYINLEMTMDINKMLQKKIRADQAQRNEKGPHKDDRHHLGTPERNEEKQTQNLSTRNSENVFGKGQKTRKDWHSQGSRERLYYLERDLKQLDALINEADEKGIGTSTHKEKSNRWQSFGNYILSKEKCMTTRPTG